MTEVLGFTLEEAQHILEAEGYEVILNGVFCKKGPAGRDMRVVSQKMLADKRIILYYSGFKTMPD